ACELANEVAYQCLQIHGGYGYMKEYPIERFYRDMRVMSIGGGTSEIMKEIIAKKMEI
ncbi:MAG: acyl-CoA dehydrogenase family protein, partial [Candidatus Aenigmatarchaeota archaeon]